MAQSNRYKLDKRLKKLSSSINNYDDLWNQWNLIDSMNIDDFDDEYPNSCLCSKHPIHIINFMKNCYTNERCIIGCCCIKRFAPIELKTDLKIKRGKKKGNRYCEICKRKLPDSYDSWKIYHTKCYNKKMG
jgi:hypothetical protein